jgi:uncharacterized membrane protein YphA (DoxX/SURF4 family)
MPFNSRFIGIAAGWVLIAVAIICGFLISKAEDFNLIFLAALVVLVGAMILYSFRFGYWQITCSRILLGCLFIFSGFVKGVDPLGFQYRLEDYFIAFGTDWAIPFALPFAIIAITIEFLAGVLLLLNVCTRFTSWLVMVIMVFFTGLTLNDAISNPVPDCGCFGDAVKLTNWQTFYKNLVIDSLLMIVFLSRKRMRGWFKRGGEWLIAALALIGIVWFQVHCIRHLPVIDFSDWKAGKKMVVEDVKPVRIFLKYRNKDSGEEEVFLSPNYPFNDSTWLGKWEFVSQRVDDPNARLHNLKIEDAERNDFTESILGNPGYQFILISSDLLKANPKGLKKAISLGSDCQSNGIDFAILTASIPEEVEIVKSRLDYQPLIYYADDIELKIMVRSNPGLLLMQNGTILGKWHYNDILEFSEYSKEFEIQ